MLNAFIGSPPEISQYSCHAQSGGGAVPGRSPFFNCFQVLKGSTWEMFNKRANLIKHEWRFVRPAPCFVIPLVVWILDETLLLVLAIPYRAIVPRQIENNAYANFWRKSKEYYSTLEKVYKAFLHDVTAAKTMKQRPCWCPKPYPVGVELFSCVNAFFCSNK